MSPRHRTLRRMTVDDGIFADTTFEMLMGNDVGPRKEFLIEGAYRAGRRRDRRLRTAGRRSVSSPVSTS